MTLLARLRHLLRCRAVSRASAVLVALALVSATVPRWESHVHARGDHEHAHAELHAAHHAEASAPTAAADPMENPHAHPIAPVAVALPAAAQLELAVAPSQAWASPRRGRTAESPPSAPPHRPPIC